MDERTLRLNLSFVLHEHSASRTVRAAAAECRAHLRLLPRAIARFRASPHDSIVNADRFLKAPACVVLTATLGAPQLLGRVTTSHPDYPGVLFADRVLPDSPAVELFRAPARLALPAAPVEGLIVAAVVLRPGGQSSELRWSGPFQWPDDGDAVIRALEGLIQPFATQWMPVEALWAAPAEVLLGDEIRAAE